jgi:hypothetical protein
MSLLDKASLIVTPNAYKESKLYSVVPSSGAGDMDVVRATTATRVNSAGLIEVVPRNLLGYSNDFTNGVWTLDGNGVGQSVTPNYAISPDGTQNASRLQLNKTGGTFSRIFQTGVFVSGINTISVYMKSNTNLSQNVGLRMASNGINCLVTTSWQRFTLTSNETSSNFQILLFDSIVGNDEICDILIYASQSENFATATEYFPTTTRLNIPRIDYTNGSCPSLLVEPQRTNLITYSQQFDDASWSKTSVSVTANSTISPDGTLNADTITSTSTSGDPQIIKNLAISINTTYSYSFYVKKDNNESRFPEFLLRTESTSFIEQYVQLNTKTGAIAVRFASSGTSRKVESLGDYWRLTLTNVNLLDTSIRVGIRPAATNVIGTYNPQIGSIICYGAQLEAGAYPTSYIPTVASTVTRNFDQISKTGISSLIGQTEGVVFFDGKLKDNLATTKQIFQLTDGTDNNRIQLSSFSTTLFMFIIKNNVVQLNISYALPNFSDNKKIAYVYSNNNFKLFVDGVLVSTNTTLSVPNTSVLNIGSYSTFGQNNFLNINSLQLYKTTLTDEELTLLTGNLYDSYNEMANNLNYILQ